MQRNSLRTSDLPEHVDDAREGLRRLRVPEEREGEPVANHEREEHLSAHRADHRVSLGRDDIGIGLEPFEQVCAGAPDAATCIGLRLRLLARPAARPREGQVVLLRGEEAVPDPSVDRASRVSSEQLRVARDHRVDGLPLPCGRSKRLAHHAHHRLVWMDAAAAVDEDAPVVGLCARGDVVAFLERAVVLALASVADVGGPVQADAHGLAEVRARLEASWRVLPADVAEAVERRPRAVVEAPAQPVRAPVVLVAVDPAVQQLSRDGRLRPPERFGYAGHVVSAAEHELDAVPFVLSHVFHGLAPFCVPASTGGARRRICPYAERIHETLSKSKRGFPS